MNLVSCKEQGIHHVGRQQSENYRHHAVAACRILQDEIIASFLRQSGI